MNRYGRWQRTIGENMAFGDFRPEDARMGVMQLLIDDGVPGRGHRANVINPAFRSIGVSCGPHPAHDLSCVIVYAGGYQETSRPAHIRERD